MEINNKEYSIIRDILNRILDAYDDDGNLNGENDYYNNIILRNLSQEELKILKNF